LINMTDEMRQQRRDEIFATSIEEFHQLGKFLSSNNGNEQNVILGSANAIDNANSKAGAIYKITKIM